MNEKQTHTPIPWEHITTAKKTEAVYGPEGDCIAVCSGIVAPNEANAAFIVRAVNNHEALLTEYQALLVRVQTMATAMRRKGLGGWVNEWLSDGVLDGNAIAKATA